MRLRIAAARGLRIDIPKMDSVKVLKEIVCILPYRLLMFRPAEKKTVSNGEEKVFISLLKSLAQKVLILSSGLSLDSGDRCLQRFVHMVAVQYEGAVGKPFQASPDPSCAISMQIDPRALQIIPPFQFCQEFFPQLIRLLPALADVEYVFTDAAVSLFFDALVPTDQRGDGASPGLQPHMVLVGVNMDHWHLTARNGLFPRLALAHLVQDGLPADRSVCHDLAALGIRQFPGSFHQRQTDAAAHPFIGGDPCDLIHGVAVCVPSFLR